MRAFFAALLLTLAACQAQATVDTYTFDTPQQEAQFKELIAELRCPKCQNQNLADSDAALAKDLKDKVYQMTMAGQSREQIISYMKARYGDFVHYRPPLRLDTLLLWFGPVLVLLVGLVVIVRRAKASQQQADSLAEDEQARLAALLEEEEKRR
ncbi:cytochrome c-type biogenesis protein [Gallaecimonas sp. GXIMD4217]|uniref:cytochrome c-type biogenesis protein n=1 Tax=Gallaecimonas sp. GXIMD4217 TaxID=3131927 RepID=UPI00311B1661